MTARQEHGFAFEDVVFDGFEGVEKSNRYTARHDGVTTQGNKKVNISVKTRNRGSELCLGDAKRIASDYEPLLLIEGTYKTKRSIDTINAYYLDSGMSYFLGEKATYQRHQFIRFDKWMNSTPEINSHAFDKQWGVGRCALRKACKDNLVGKDACIVPRPKRDHKKQHRLQCAITKVSMRDIVSRFMVATIDKTNITVTDIAANEVHECADFAECMTCAKQIIDKAIADPEFD